MRNKKLLQLEKPDSAQHAALSGQILASSNLPLLNDKSRMARYEGLTELGKTQRATAQLPLVFDHLYCQLERLYVQKSAPPARRRTQTISWEEPEELLLGINVNLCATRESPSANETSAIEHASSPAAAAFSIPTHP